MGRVYIVYQYAKGGAYKLLAVYDNYTAAEDCVLGGWAAGLDRWSDVADLQDEYVEENVVTPIATIGQE